MKTVLITGGHGDIGQAIVTQFEQRDYHVIKPGSQTLNLEQLESVDSFIDELSPIDAFIHCAGVNDPAPFVNLSFENLQRTVTINSFAFYKIVQGLVAQKKLVAEGHILGISSIYGHISRTGRFAYTSAKACLNGMIKNLALELGAEGIKVNGLAPGFVNTKLTRKNNSAETIRSLERAVPLGFLAEVEDIAKAAYFFASPDNRYITGQVIVADGGYLSGGFQP